MISGLLILFNSSCKKVEAEEVTTYEDVYINTLHSGTLESFSDVHFFDELKGVVVGTSGGVYTTEDGGLIWDVDFPLEIKEDTNLVFNGVHFINESVGWIYGAITAGSGYHPETIGNIFIKTTDSGESWDDDWFGEEDIAVDMLNFYNESLGFLSTDNGTLYKTNDGGNNWVEVFVLENGKTINDIAFVDENTIMFVGTEGVIYVSTDKGDSWSEDSNAPAGRAYLAAEFNGTNGYLTGGGDNSPNDDKAFVYKVEFANGMFTYNDITNPYYSVYHFDDLHISSANNTLWVCGHLGQVFMTKDSGATWSDELTRSQREETLNAMCFPSDNIGYFVGRGGIILKVVL